MAISLTAEQRATFARDGFLIVENVLDDETVAAAAARFEPLFAGTFETGMQPDEWNWRPGRDPEDVTRQICNGWKADRLIASIVLREDVGRALAEVSGWPGARIIHDNVIWKQPGGKPLGFHQDDSYQQWYRPSEMTSCWMPLDDTRADQGTIEYVPGSHLWPLSPPIAQFHAPDDPLVDMLAAAKHAGVSDPEIVPIEIPAGAAVLHHGRVWHGSRDNRGSKPRRSLVSHCGSSAAEYVSDGTHTQGVGVVYARYKRPNATVMDEAYFPVLWTTEGGRTARLGSTQRDARRLTSGGEHAMFPLCTIYARLLIAPRRLLRATVPIHRRIRRARLRLTDGSLIACACNGANASAAAAGR